MTALLLGAGLGVGLALWMRRRPPAAERRTYAVGLAAAAAVYVVFALTAGRVGWLLLETGGLALFASLAWLGQTRSRWWLAAGWLVHVAWDLALHPGGSPGFVPAWYPPLCAGFDPVVAAAVVWRRD